MTIEITHKFQSAKGDGLDTSQVQPSNWNDTHSITMATDNLLGRETAGAGAAEEITCTPLARQILAALTPADVANILGGFTTGDAKLTFKSTADTGWIMLDDGSIGGTGSGATTFAGPEAQPLYVLLWGAVADTWAPVSGGRGATAAADFSAGKKMTLPKALGRALVIAGAGAGLTTRVLGSAFGEEAHVLTMAELPASPPTGTVAGNAPLNANVIFGTPQQVDLNFGNFGLITCSSAQQVSRTATINSSNTTFTGANLGSGTAHNNTQASIGLNVMVKL